MNDTDRMTQLLTARHPCVTILTYEEAQAISVVRGAAGKVTLDLLEWSVSTGLKDGLAAAAPVVPNTEHPAAALAYLCDREERMVAVFCDLAAHLKDERVMRLLRELIFRFAKAGGCVVLGEAALASRSADRAAAAMAAATSPRGQRACGSPPSSPGRTSSPCNSCGEPTRPRWPRSARHSRGRPSGAPNNSTTCARGASRPATAGSARARSR